MDVLIFRIFFPGGPDTMGIKRLRQANLYCDAPHISAFYSSSSQALKSFPS